MSRSSAADDNTALIDRIRTSSRQMVRELGFMRPTLAATPYPPSAVHALLEVGAAGSLTAGQLADDLQLDKSSVSRLLRKLVDAGELEETTQRDDRRVKPLVLTARGRRTLAAIHAFARGQVGTALAGLAPAQREAVDQGLALYAHSLRGQRGAPVEAPASAPEVHIVRGYRPGAIGAIAALHAHYYARERGFGVAFESKVAAGLADFCPRLAKPYNGLWLALAGERIVGSVAIDGEDLAARQAHLRWLIVDDGQRGGGVGRRLLAEALAFCDARRFAATQLWTLQGLDAARRLYEGSGFELAETFVGTQWGRRVTEQRFVRPRLRSPG
ncbi:MAG: bifunctional helix-turn-helix transcriptional regulator/GNAT family N-acetyltransferase [Burkholderiales bacterium]